jgi:hypothetical protein
MQRQSFISGRALTIDPGRIETALGHAKYGRRDSSVKVRDSAPDIRRRTTIVYKESVVAGASHEEV